MAVTVSAGERMAQRRRLVRVPDLEAFRATLIHAALDGSPVDIRRRAIILPSRGAIELLRRSLEDARLSAAARAVVVPALLTREDWLSALAASVPGAPPLFDRMAREVLFERAARDAAADAPPPFAIRPGLVGAMLDFYDELRRRGRTIARFAEVLDAELAGADRDDDRGSHELMRQTAFLTGAFTAYEARVAAAAAAGVGIDEHQLRARVLAAPDAWPVTHVLVAVADHPTDPRGLWPADFDLLGRLAGVDRLDVFVTEDAHDAGFRERIDREIPELVDTRVVAEPRRPSLAVPPTAGDAVCIDYRDREEELRAVARAIRARAAAGEVAPLSRTAIVFQRPLPYLYLAQHVLDDAGVTYQAFDALPLSAEPWAALLDLALVVARTGGTRDSVLALLRSPLLTFAEAGAFVSIGDVARLDRLLIEGRVTASPAQYPEAVRPLLERAHRLTDDDPVRIVRAARAAAALTQALAPYRHAATASAQLEAVAACLRQYERRSPPSERERHLRARSAVLATLERLAAAYRAHDDGARDPDVLSATIHRWIERQTFTPRRGSTGVHLVDAVAARFGTFDHVHIVGLVDAEWPERQRRSIFYTSSLLKDLGWPGEVDHLRAQQAGFRELVMLPSKTLSLSAFQLEGDAVVAATPLSEEARGLRVLPAPTAEARIFADERLAFAPTATEGMPASTSAWLALRVQRPELSAPVYRGDVGAQSPREYRVSQLDRYVECPFKYFAAAVLRLDEEAEEESALTPRERGTLMHGVFEQFYREWDAAGRGAVTMATLPDALAAFEQLARARLAELSEADRIIETARLMGSIVMRGAAERVFLLEAGEPRGVRRRWLEEPVNGTYEFPMGFGAKSIAIRGVADRIDELEDGSLRIVDYKLSRPPDKDAVQLKVYGYVAQRLLEARDGGSHPVAAADYIAFGDDSESKTSVAPKGGSVPEAIAAGAQEFAAHVTKIESGEFPPRPRNAGLCEWCAFALVCRKETVAAEEDDAAESA